MTLPKLTKLAAVVALFAVGALAVDNGLAVTPQMGWVSSVLQCFIPPSTNMCSFLVGQLEHLRL